MRRICVIGGCGHVGLPLSIVLAKEGHTVTIYDVDSRAGSLVREGRMPFMEFGAEEVLRDVVASGNLTVADSPSAISESDTVISIVGTPVDEHLNPTFDLMINIFSQYQEFFRDGQTLILRSTVYPGASEKVQNWLRKNNKDVSVSFCPERIAEGYAMTELYELPQIISAFDERGLAVAREVFGSLTSDIIVLEPMEAEIAKLFTNAWRYVKFATANQFYMLANDFGLDFYRIYHGMTHKYPRASDFPRPGFAAGPCLFKDTMQLSALSNNNFFIGHSAMLINEGLPNYLVSRLKFHYPLHNMIVGILGMAFKANIDDKRESLSYKLRNILSMEAGRVICSDPFVKNSSFMNETELIQMSDIIILATPHQQYRNLDFGDKPVIDIWNMFEQGAVI